MLLEGRKQRRTPQHFLVQILAVHDSRLEDLATVENASPTGARLATERLWEPGAHVVLKSSPNGNWARARVVYCQTVSAKSFAVGLNFLTRTSDWEARSGT